MNKKLVAAIDFGNDKLSIAIAYKNMDNSLELIDFWSKPLVDVSRNGILQNPNNVLMEINYYFQQAEQANNIKIGTYYFGLEPHTLRSDIQAVACRSNGDIATSIKQLEDEIAHNYAVDNRRVLLNKMLSLTQGANVQGDFLSVSVADRVKNSIDKITSNLSTERKMKFMVSPMVEADAFLSDIQRQNGVLFIDFGAEVTSFAVYKDGLPRLTHRRAQQRRPLPPQPAPAQRRTPNRPFLHRRSHQRHAPCTVQIFSGPYHRRATFLSYHSSRHAFAGGISR